MRLKISQQIDKSSESLTLASTSPKMSWNTLKETFEGEWVELVEFEWDWNRAYPLWARVRNCASDRQELIKKVHASGEVADAVIFYIGTTGSVVSLDRNFVSA